VNSNSSSSVAMPLCREADGAGSGRFPGVLGRATGVASGCAAAGSGKCATVPAQAGPRDGLASAHQPRAVQFLERVTDVHLLPAEHPARLHQLSDPGGLLQNRGAAAEGQARDELQYL
jgi:hypothetical protein